MTKPSEAETIRKLRKIIDEQQEEIWQLRRAVGLDLGFSLDLGLTAVELDLFLVMARTGSIAMERGESIMASRVYNGKTSKDVGNLFRVHIKHMRDKLHAMGIEVRTRRGVGYYLDKETLARVRPMILEDKDGLEKPADNTRSHPWANGHAHA